MSSELDNKTNLAIQAMAEALRELGKEVVRKAMLQNSQSIQNNNLKYLKHY